MSKTFAVTLIVEVDDDLDEQEVVHKLTEAEWSVDVPTLGVVINDVQNLNNL